MDVTTAASLSMVMQGAKARQDMALEMVRQQHKQMQAVASMVAAATQSAAVAGRGEVLDITV